MDNLGIGSGLMIYAEAPLSLGLRFSIQKVEQPSLT